MSAEMKASLANDNAEAGTRAGQYAGTSILALVAILAGAAWLRLHGLGHGLWQDEAFSVSFATMPSGKFWKLMWSREGNMLLYYLFLRAWVHLGTSEFVLRLPSVIFSVASIGVIYVLGKQLFSKSAGLIAALLLSVHMLDIFLSQNARSYTLTVFLLAISTLAFVRLARYPERKLYQVAYPLLAALAMYAQLLAVLVIVAQWLSLDRLRLRSMGWRRCLGIMATFFIVALPMEAFALLKNKGQLSWIPPLTYHNFLDGLYAITGYGSIALLALYLAAVLITVVSAFRTRDGEYRFAVRLTALWLAFPVVVMVLYSLHKPLFYSRFLILCVPAAALLAAEGLINLKDLGTFARWLWVPALLFIAGLSLRSDWNYYRSSMWPDWKDATRLVLANAHPNDAFCFSGNGAEVFQYYMRQEQQIPWNKLPIVYYSRGIRCLGESAEQVSRAGGATRRVWLFKTDGTEEQYQWILGLLKPQFGPPVAQGSFPSPPGRIVVFLLPGKEL